MTVRKYSGSGGFKATITANPNGTFDIATSGHGKEFRTADTCGSIHSAEREIWLRCADAKLDSETA